MSHVAARVLEGLLTETGRLVMPHMDRGSPNSSGATNLPCSPGAYCWPSYLFCALLLAPTWCGGVLDAACPRRLPTALHPAVLQHTPLLLRALPSALLGSTNFFSV